VTSNKELQATPWPRMGHLGVEENRDVDLKRTNNPFSGWRLVAGAVAPEGPEGLRVGRSGSFVRRQHR